MGSSSCIQSVVEKIGKIYQKVGETDQIVSPTFTLGLQHDKIQA
jgi:hypothetical protein